MLVMVLVLALALAVVGGGGWGYSRYGWQGVAPVGLVGLVLAVLYLAGYLGVR